ncbi:tetratricopeptide repeat protein [Gaoshiqia sediminis]|uniref:Tetratricopeptide repeat protein n=1 Tax=Gaoshiqia sediminis TaxID=2986998 RepID=A0AA41YBL3_9BACT|nr:hypothetical protein [Gaoshiqia sediminis]MCW0483218.1 hypothetical protein [Gaoshiqia sediminis]
MERSFHKYLKLLTVILVMLNFVAPAQNLKDYRCRYFHAYLEGDMEPWLEWAEEIEANHPKELDWMLVALQARYGLIGYYFGTNQKSKIKNVLQDARSKLDPLLEKHPQDARLYSLKAAFQAFEIGLTMYKAPFLGPKVESAIQRAISLNPEEPTAWLEEGNSLYNRPALFGGDKKQAILAYKKALILFGHDTVKCNYLIVLTEVFIMKGYYETGQQQLYRQTRQNLENQYGRLPWLDDFLPADIIR